MKMKTAYGRLIAMHALPGSLLSEAGLMSNMYDNQRQQFYLTENAKYLTKIPKYLKNISIIK